MSLIEKFECGDVVENRYHLDIKIHEGRWGDIYRATDQLNDRPVALRFFPVGEDGPDDYDRFEANARELSGLTAPTIATPSDHGLEDDVPYLVYRWAHGQNLQDRLAEKGALDLDKTVLILEKVLDGLSRAHDSRLTHGLLRPVKIIVDDLDNDPFVKIVDLQIWRFFEWSSGKKAFDESNLSRRIVRYTSPEVLDEHRVKPATDIYATGLITIEMLTGQPAFDDNNRVALIARQLGDELADPGPDAGIGDVFREFIDKLVAKDEQDRFRTGAQALDAFDEKSDTFLSEPATSGEVPEQDTTDDAGEPDDKPNQSAPPKGVLKPGSNSADEQSDSDDDASGGTSIYPPPAGDDEGDEEPDEASGGTSIYPPPADDGEDDEKTGSSGFQLPDPSEVSEASEADAEKENSDVDPDDELFEGDPAKMHSLSDGDSFADEGESIDDEDDELFESEPNFGSLYDESSESTAVDDDKSSSEPELQLDESPPTPMSESSSGADVDGDAFEFDDSFDEEIPTATTPDSSSPGRRPDTGGHAPHRGGPGQTAPSSPGDQSGGYGQPGQQSGGYNQAAGSPPQRQPEPRPANQAPARRSPPSSSSDTDISMPVAVGIAVAMLLAIGGATFHLVFSDSSSGEEETAAAELAEEEDEEIFVVDIGTNPPAQHVEIIEGPSGLSPLEVEVVEADFPLEIQARLDADNIENQVVEEPGDHELFFEFDD